MLGDRALSFFIKARLWSSGRTRGSCTHHSPHLSLLGEPAPGKDWRQSGSSPCSLCLVSCSLWASFPPFYKGDDWGGTAHAGRSTGGTHTAPARLNEPSPCVRFIQSSFPIPASSKSPLTISLASPSQSRPELRYVGAPEFLTHPKAESGRNTCSPETGGPES